MDEESFLPVDTPSLTITPSMWFAINEWLTLSQLMPIFVLNDVDTMRDVWNPKPVLPLLEISDKLNVTCFWQLGFGELLIDLYIKALYFEYESMLCTSTGFLKEKSSGLDGIVIVLKNCVPELALVLTSLF